MKYEFNKTINRDRGCKTLCPRNKETLKKESF